MIKLSPRFYIITSLYIALYAGNLAADTIPQLSPPFFSHISGFYDSPFTLVLHSDIPGAVIYYTIDGSDPDPGNLEGSTYKYKNEWGFQPGDTSGNYITGSYTTFVFTSPIHIADRSYETDSLTNKASSYHNPPYYFPAAPVFKGTVIRAITVKDGHPASPVETHSYFVHPKGRARFTLPVISINTAVNNLFDYEQGIYTPGVAFNNWRENNPDSRSNGGRPANYHHRGEKWEYPAHFAFWDSTSRHPDIGQNIGFRIHGGWSRAYPMKSLRIYSRSDYGVSRLEYPFFNDNDYDEYNRLILRNSGNDFNYTLFRDALIQKVFHNQRFETQAYRPSVLFINGEYWGIHNIRERYDKHYLKRVYKVDHDYIDLLTYNSVIQEGYDTHYIETLTYIEENGLEDANHYEFIKTRIDTENFIDYNIANIFAANTDWPGNNIDYWRKKTDKYLPDSPYGHDGRWRWLLYDMDFGFGLAQGADHHTLEMATEAGGTEWPNPDWATFMLRNFLKNEGFKYDFLNRYADLLNSTLKPHRLINLIELFRERLLPEIDEHLSRWKSPADFKAWEKNINIMTSFAKERSSHQWSQLTDYFDLSDTVSITVDVSDSLHGYIRINTLKIIPEEPGINHPVYPWKGTYFKDITVELEAIPLDGYIFSHWEGARDHKNPVIIACPSEIPLARAVFIPEEPGSTMKTYYSKATGHLYELSSWGSNPDGSGAAPVSFGANNQTLKIHNRSTATLKNDWSVSGRSSRVIVGGDNHQVTFTIPAEFLFTGDMEISGSSKLVVQNSVVPDLVNVSPISTVIFEQNEFVTVPANKYGNLSLEHNLTGLSGNYVIKGDLKVRDTDLYFEPGTSIAIEGNMHLLGIIDTYKPENVNILANGFKDQLFYAEHNNKIDAYNFYIEKSEGRFTLASDVHARNNLRLDIIKDAEFSDGGHILQLEDDLRINGADRNFDLTGTILLTSRKGTNDLEISDVSVNNLVIDIEGDARVDFNKSDNLVKIKNDLIIISRSSRPVRLRDKRFHINGNLTLDLPDPDQTEQGHSYLFFTGDNEQIITNLGHTGPGLLKNMIMDNPAGVIIENGGVTFDGIIHFENGLITSSRENLLKVGPDGKISQYFNESYVTGPLGIYVNSSEPVCRMRFPIGKENGIRQVILDAEYDNSGQALFIAEYFSMPPPVNTGNNDSFEIIENEGYYTLQTGYETNITRASVDLTFSETSEPAKNLRIVSRNEESWINLGGVEVAENESMIRSTINFDKMGMFAIARSKNHPVFMDNEFLIPVFPNPVYKPGKIYLPDTMDINLFDSSGFVLRSEKNVSMMDLGGLEPGIYFIKNEKGQFARIVILGK